MIKTYPHIVIITFLFFCSCNRDNRVANIQKVMNHWVGKTIEFPEDVSPHGIIENSEKAINYPYKILLYVDSLGCTGCKLKLSTWKSYIEELNLIAPNKVEFKFYFQPKKEREIIHLLKQSSFDYPVYIDIFGEINTKNKFPQQIEFQCFLLDHDNKVISIGNPVLNPNIWDLYKQIITGDKSLDNSPTTSITINKSEIDFGSLKLGETVDIAFHIKNTGEIPFIISNIDASCGCTLPTWSKKPVEPNKSTKIEVAITPNESGFLSKTIYVHANVDSKKIPLQITGMVIK